MIAALELSRYVTMTAIESAWEYVDRHGMVVRDEELCRRVKKELKESIDGILEDAKDAYRAEMMAEVKAIILLSVKQCGVDAAKAFE